MKEKIILVGGGGHCSSCIDVIEAEGLYEIAGIVEVPEKVGEQVLGYPVIASDNDLSQLVQRDVSFLVTVGQIKSSAQRRKLYEQLLSLEAVLPTIISPRAYVSRHAFVGQGTIVMHDALVNAGAQVGSNCILNTKSLIEHDAVVEDHCHISTGAIINGEVQIGEGSFIGSNAVTVHGANIGPDSFVRAGNLERGS